MQENLHFVVVGHVDHGKSTLIGRLLYDTNSLPADKIEELRSLSSQDGGQPEFAFVMDHLEEERSQHITIDTAQIFFKTAKRHYVIIDAPGHKQFLRNMITGATQAEAALLLIDAAEGLREQTHRHAYMLSLLGLKQITVVINKMDLVGFGEQVFADLSSEITARLAEFSLEPLKIVPISARMGDNVATRSENLSWYDGSTLLEALDELQCAKGQDDGPGRFPVQDVYDVDGQKVLVGRIVSGGIKAADKLTFYPSGIEGVVDHIKLMDGNRASAVTGESIGLVLKDGAVARGLKRGETGCAAGTEPIVTDKMVVTVFWMDSKPLRAGETVDLKCATQQVSVHVDEIRRRLDSATLELIEDSASELHDTEVAQLAIRADAKLCMDPFEEVAETGRFVLLRRNDTVAGGVVHQQ